MAGKRIFGRSLTICAVVLGLAAAAAPASAQTGGMKGKVVDAQNKPVDGATVTLVQVDTNSKFTLKSKKGEFMQIGLPPGNYTVTVEKDGMKQTSNVRVSLDIAETTITLKPGGSGAPMTKEEAAKAQAKMEGFKTAFSEGAALSNAGKYDEAIAKFNQVLADVPKCTECYINIGATIRPEKGLRERGDGLQEGAGARSELGRGVQRPGVDLQRSAEVHRSAGDERRGEQARRSRSGGRRAARQRMPTRCTTRV